MQILTDDGFKDFDGIMRKKAKCLEIGYKCEWDNSRTINYLKGSDDHQVMVIPRNKEWDLTIDSCKWIRLDKIVIGDKLAISENGKVLEGIVVSIKQIGINDVYSPINVDGIRYLEVNGTVNHNCAFGGSTSTLISEEGLDKMRVEDPIEYKLGYDFLIYEQPEPNALYVMGVDSAMGVAADYSVVQVLKVLKKGKYKQVAVYHRNTIRPEDFAEVVHDISVMYNSAMYIIENNDIGRTVADVLYYEIGDNGMISTDKRGNLGTRADRNTKIDACKILKTMIEKGELSVVDSETVKELSRFEEVSTGVYRATGDNHDDLVSGLYWAAYCLTQPEIDLDGVCVAEVKAAESDALPPPMYMNGPGDSLFGAGMDAVSFWKGLN